MTVHDLVQAPIHTRAVFNHEQLPRIVDWVVEVMRRERFGAIAASGHSGLVVAGAVGYILRIPVIAVRKKGEVALGDKRRVNAVLTKDHTVYAFVDDLIGGGTTLRNVVEQVREVFGDRRAECGGILLYNAEKGMAQSALDTMDNFSSQFPLYTTLPLFIRPRSRDDISCLL